MNVQPAAKRIRSSLLQWDPAVSMSRTWTYIDQRSLAAFTAFVDNLPATNPRHLDPILCELQRTEQFEVAQALSLPAHHRHHQRDAHGQQGRRAEHPSDADGILPTRGRKG